jgi:hypothetical protein
LENIFFNQMCPKEDFLSGSLLLLDEMDESEPELKEVPVFSSSEIGFEDRLPEGRSVGSLSP